MAVQSITQYRIVPGGGKAFFSAMAEEQALRTRQGAVASLRMIIVGGEATDIIGQILAFPTAAARAAAMDEAMKDPDESPLVYALRAADPPASVLGRIYLNEFPETELVPAAPAVVTTLRWRINPGRLLEGEAAMLDVRRIQSEAGGDAHLWTLNAAGPSTGERWMSVGNASWAESEERIARVMAGVAARGTRGPMTTVFESGAVVPLGVTMSVLVEL